MAIQKVMNRFVPFPIKLLEGEGVPPILIKFSEVQPSYLGEEVTHVLEDQVEAENDEGSAG
jgi:hypothetical protein